MSGDQTTFVDVVKSFTDIINEAIPVIAEVDKSLTLDPNDLEKKITPQTKAVVVVHMRGMPARMDKIMDIAKKHNLKIIEDVAQACGGTYNGKYLGTFGDCGCFSFQYHKIIYILFHHEPILFPDYY